MDASKKFIVATRGLEFDFELFIGGRGKELGGLTRFNLSALQLCWKFNSFCECLIELLIESTSIALRHRYTPR